MIDGKVYQAICAECEESSDVDRFGVAIAWKIAHGIETEHVSIDIVSPGNDNNMLSIEKSQHLIQRYP